MSENHEAELACWETIDRKRLVDASPWLSVWVDTVRLPDGRVVDDFYTVDQPDHVVIFAIDKDDRAVALRHYKHGPRCVNLGFPAGYMMPGEDPLEAARRELFEETGYRAADWKHLGSFTVDGNRGNGKGHYFLALGAVHEAEVVPDDLEELRIELIKVTELDSLLKTSVATLDAAAMIGLALNELNAIRQ
jgi:ADP-ribose pyrophosphatase